MAVSHIPPNHTPTGWWLRMDAVERMRPTFPLNTVDFRGMSRLMRTRLDGKMERVKGIEPSS